MFTMNFCIKEVVIMKETKKIIERQRLDKITLFCVALTIVCLGTTVIGVPKWVGWIYIVVAVLITIMALRWERLCKKFPWLRN